MTRPRVSVCMATYNGSKYVEHQLRSILAQLAEGDEIVIVDDASTDDTRAVIAAIEDPRIRLIARDVNRGYVRTFEEALGAASGDVLLLSDQDDEWVDGRVDALVAATRERAVAAGNLVLLGDDAPLPNPISGKPWSLSARTGNQSVRNRVRILAGMAPYFGCAMAIRREFLPRVLPFPDALTESHDLWIAITANTAHEMAHVESPVIRRRLHDSNASPSRPRSIGQVLRARLMLLQMCGIARKRVRPSS